MMRARIELGTEAARQEQEAHDVAQVVRAELSWTPLFWILIQLLVT